MAVTEGAKDFRTGPEHAVAAIDGNPSGYVAMQKPAPIDGVVEFLYSLSAPTVFDGFMVPNIKETPSPSQTFFGNIQVLGSAGGPDGPFRAAGHGRPVDPHRGRAGDRAFDAGRRAQGRLGAGASLRRRSRV